MTDLEMLLQTVDNICKRLENMAQDEIRFCVNTQMQLQKTSGDIQRSISDLNSIHQFYGC